MTKRFAILGVEGPHDQALIGKVLKHFGFQDFASETAGGGRENALDPFWRGFIPTYPTTSAKLYTRLSMPSILFNNEMSVAVYVGEGSKLSKSLKDILFNHTKYKTEIVAFGIIVDSDKKQPDAVAKSYADEWKEVFPDFPCEPGAVHTGTPRTGVFVLPDNTNTGVLDTLLCKCGDVVYTEYMKRARDYLAKFSKEELSDHSWGPFDREKALVATVVSVLKPGKTNTVSLSDNKWVSDRTISAVAELKQFSNFLQDLLVAQNDALSVSEKT